MSICFKTLIFSLMAIYSQFGFAKNNEFTNTISNLSLESLKSFKTKKLPAQTPMVLYFFQPDCASCAKQKKDLACLPLKVRLFSIGIFGTKLELLKEAQKHQMSGEWLYGGKHAEKKFAITQTPTLLFVNNKGELIDRVSSWLPCEDIKMKANKL